MKNLYLFFFIRLDCIKQLQEGSVDVTVADNYQLYLAHLMFENDLIPLGETRVSKEVISKYIMQS